MAMESSHPLMEAFQGEELGEEEAELEEDMVCCIKFENQSIVCYSRFLMLGF